MLCEIHQYLYSIFDSLGWDWFFAIFRKFHDNFTKIASVLSGNANYSNLFPGRDAHWKISILKMSGCLNKFNIRTVPEIFNLKVFKMWKFIQCDEISPQRRWWVTRLYRHEHWHRRTTVNTQSIYHHNIICRAKYYFPSIQLAWT